MPPGREGRVSGSGVSALERNPQTLSRDVAVGMVAGLVATKATDLAQGPLRRATPDSVRRQEELISPGPSSSQVAARRIAERLGRRLDDRRLRPAAKVVHYGLGMAWGPVYGLLRRHCGLGPLGAGLLAGGSLSLVVDEGLAPALGLSAPNRDCPAGTHVRGFVAHLVWGAAAALAAEAAYRLTGTAPERRARAAYRTRKSGFRSRGLIADRPSSS